MNDEKTWANKFLQLMGEANRSESDSDEREIIMIELGDMVMHHQGIFFDAVRPYLYPPPAVPEPLPFGDVDDRVIATFHPQVWVRDYAMEVDPEGPVKWDVTEIIEAEGKETTLEWQDDRDETDLLRHSTRTPKWIVEWTGPFWVEVEQSIKRYWRYKEMHNG